MTIIEFLVKFPSEKKL